MSVTQYIGARYVPLFSEPLDWDIAKEYEPLTIVYYAGNSYTSRQSVPKNIDINNEEYWALTGNYNAQIEQYRKEVRAYDARIAANADAIAAEKTRAKNAEQTNADAIAAENTRAKNAEQTNADAIAAEKTRAENAEQAIATKKSIKKKIVMLGDSWTQAENKKLETAFASFDDVDAVYNYGVSGATIQNLASQAENAYNDNSFDNDEITDVVIVCGTNNVYWNNECDYSTAYDSFKAVTSKFTKATTHYFPNNSRTYNSGLNWRYSIFCNAALSAGAVPHMEILMLIIFDGYSRYNGTTTYGVQHLTEQGYSDYASFAHSIMNGANYANYPVSFPIAMKPSGDSSVTASQITAQYEGTVSSGIITARFTSTQWNTGYSSTNPGTAKFESYNDTNGDNTSPVNIHSKILKNAIPVVINAGKDSQILSAAQAYDEAYWLNLQVPLPNNITPGIFDFYIPISNVLGL